MGPRGWGPYGYPMGGPGWGGPMGGPGLRGPFSPGARMVSDELMNAPRTRSRSDLNSQNHYRALLVLLLAWEWDTGVGAYRWDILLRGQR